MKLATFTSVTEAHQLLEDTPLRTNEEAGFQSSRLAGIEKCTPEKASMPNKHNKRAFELLKERNIKGVIDNHSSEKARSPEKRWSPIKKRSPEMRSPEKRSPAKFSPMKTSILPSNKRAFEMLKQRTMIKSAIDNQKPLLKT